MEGQLDFYNYTLGVPNLWLAGQIWSMKLCNPACRALQETRNLAVNVAIASPLPNFHALWARWHGSASRSLLTCLGVDNG